MKTDKVRCKTYKEKGKTKKVSFNTEKVRCKPHKVKCTDKGRTGEEIDTTNKVKGKTLQSSFPCGQQYKQLSNDL